MEFSYQEERFADLQLLRYRLNGFDQLTPQQKALVFYLSEATLWGRDITFDQFGKYNLRIRKMLEVLYCDATIDRDTDDFKALEVYLKRVWFSSGIYHHYGSEKFKPDFSPSWLKKQLHQVDSRRLPLQEGETVDVFCETIFPVIFDTNISANHLGTTKFMFDMLIMDEAGQCDMARSLIPLSRAKNCLLVGDPMQLRPVIVLDPVVNEKLKNKYTISETFDYIENSILSHHTRVDKISKRILLSYHYRCGKKIIQFCNAHYYNNELDTSVIKNIGEIKLFACQNTALNSKGHIALEEARGMVDYIKKYGYNDPKKTKGGVAILVAFKDQEALVNDLLEKEGITNVKACTIHSMQGAEADTVFFSPAISRRTSLKTYEWLQNNAEVMNVGVSRAKQELFVFADEGAIESLSKRSNNKTDALLSLIKYAKSQGDVTILPRSTNYASFEKSNNSEAEDEFHKTVCQALSMDRYYRIERDIHIDKVFPKDVDAQRHHQMMFDSVIYTKHFTREKPIIAFEIAGGEHYQRGRNDKIKETICNNNGVKYIMVPNADVKDYELIKSFLEISFARKPAEKKQGMEQLSLLEEVTL